MESTNIFSQNLKLLRIKNNMKSLELANKLGVSPSVISSWENGRHLPALPYIIKLSEIFNISTDELLGISQKLSNVLLDNIQDQDDFKKINKLFYDISPLTKEEIETLTDTLELLKLRRIKKRH